MTTTTTRPGRNWIWLLVAGILSVIGIGILWPLQQVGQVCALIYPAPPGCGADEPRWVPLVAIGLVIAIMTALVIVHFTVVRALLPQALLTAAIPVVTIAASLIVAISQTGIWDPYQPPVMIQ